MPAVRTSHAGSLPRPERLTSLLAQLARGESVDTDRLRAATDDAVRDVIARQIAAGLDIVNDGEQGRESFFTYVQHRMTGFAPGGDIVPRRWRDVDDFPGFAEIRRAQRSARDQVSLVRPPQAIGAVSYADTTAVDEDCARLLGALSSHHGVSGFMTSASPGIVAAAMANRHYPDDDAYLDAVGAALGVEYRRIVDAGLLLQIDAPDLAMERHGRFAERSTGEFLSFVDRVIDVTNQALSGIDPAMVRLHVCWGNYGGPHTHDIPLTDLLPHLYRANVGGLLLSGANPRHEHEYKEFVSQPLPEHWQLATGVIDTTTNYVEHPEVVADRIERVVGAIGDPARVVACTDCGFDTSAGFGSVAGDVAWAKLDSLVEGARLVGQRVG